MDSSNNQIQNEQHKKFRKLIHDIRNMIKLTPENIDYMKTLEDEQKMEIILEYDKVLQTMVQTLYTNL
jgi:hypothetical protein